MATPGIHSSYDDVNFNGKSQFTGGATGVPTAPSPSPMATAQSPFAGLQPGVPNGPASIDRSGPSSTSQYYDRNKSVWESPSGGETNTWGLINQANQGHNAGSANTQDWFNQYAGNMPSISTEPGFGAYYDNAKNRAQESINQSMAARGSYGSSAANDQISRAYTDLDADRARNEADYNLKRLGEQRQWQGLGGQLAGSADSNNLAVSADDRAWIDQLGRMGLDASKLGLDRTNAGMDASVNSDNVLRNNQNDYFEQNFKMGSSLSDLIKSLGMFGIGNDAELQDKQTSGGIAEGVNANNAETQRGNELVSTAGTVANLYDKYKGNP